MFSWNSQSAWCVSSCEAAQICSILLNSSTNMSHFRTPFPGKLHNFQTVQYETHVAPGKNVDLRCEIVQHQGRNAKQNNVTIVPVD